MERKKKNYKLFTQNVLMANGNSCSSEKIINNFFKAIQKKTKKDYKIVYKLAIKNTVSTVSNIEIKKRKKRYYVPFFIKKHNRVYRTIKFICSVKNITAFKNKLFLSEIINLSNNKPSLIKLSVNSVNSKSFTNKNFASFRWFN